MRLAATILTGLLFAVFSQQPAEFTIPPEAAKRSNPMRSTPVSLAEGRRAYKTQCAMCHGAKGDGKGELAVTMQLQLRDWNDPAALKGFTDGELFFILDKGKGQMPAQEGRMKPAQEWHLINFIRSLAKKTEAPEKPKR